jgi:shikimate 5-dehydrogenase
MELGIRGKVALNTVYKPMETPYLGMAEDAGARTLNGLTWAVYTCATSVRLFTGREPSPDAMRQAALDMGQKKGW